MKKLLLATAVAALSVSAANAAPTVYGKAFVGMDYVNVDDNIGTDTDDDSVQINSYSSRLGFRGSEALSANTDVIYQYELGISIDGETSGFSSRDTFLGLKNDSYGEFRFGRNTSVLDYVNNVITSGSGYWDNLGSNRLETNENGVNMTDSGRRNNSVIWKAPKYNNLPLDVALMYKADESFDDSDNSDSGFAASAMYDAGTGVTFGLAYDNDVNLDGDLIRGTATVDMSNFVAYPVTVGALYQVADFDSTAENRGDEDEKGMVLSAKMGLNNFAKPAAVYVQYNNTKDVLGIDDYDSDQIVVGGEYQFRKNMIAHAYVGQNSAELGDDDYDLFAAGGGLEYKF
uniref:porin n=1 Tax=uncultured Psychrobacter sp. TaxID=259303 RepID=UPI002633E19B|nr:porin [uncultured Psychrobacter sp.]